MGRQKHRSFPLDEGPAEGDLRTNPHVTTPTPLVLFLADVPASLPTFEPVLWIAIAAATTVGLWLIGQVRAFRRREWANRVAYVVRAKDVDELGRLARSPEIAKWAPALEDVLEELRDTLVRDRARIETAESSSARMRARVEQSPIAELTVDATGRIVSASEATCRLFHMLRSEIVGTNVADVLLEPDDWCVTEDAWVIDALALADGTSAELRVLTTHAGRKTCVVAVSRAIAAREAPDSEREQTGRIIALVDVSRAKHAIAPRVRGAQDALVRLAGTVAFDFNDRLTTILGHTAIVQDQHTDDALTMHSIAEITHAVEHARLLTRQLMAVGRPSSVRSEVCDLNEAVRSALPQVQFVLGGTEAVLNLSPHAGSIRGSAAQVEEMLVHLLRNASEAMHASGTVVIETSRGRRATATDSDGVSIDSEEAVCLRVRDEGERVEPFEPTQWTDPFFTTKPGREIGLGLAIVDHLVESNEGTLEFRRRASGGISVEIAWAAVTSEVEGLMTRSDPAEIRLPASQATRAICVVEDDPGVRRIVSRALERAGYEVGEAASGEEALGVFGARPGGYSLLVTDVNMPSMSGSELYEKLHATYGSFGVLYMSGHVDREVFHNAQPWVHDFLQKPFSPAELIAKVENVFAKSDSSKRRRRVLVVDDEEETRRVMQRLLDGLDIESYLVEDGEVALEALERMSIDAVISDLVMPCVESFNACAEIHRRHPDVKIIAMTDALPSSYHREAARALGAVSTLLKPFSRDDLQLALEAAFQAD